MNKYKNIFIIGIFLLTIYLFLFPIIQNSNFYTREYDVDFFAELYSNSQYVKGEKATRGIGDDGLYAFAGYYYINGGDPSQVNFEHPPLGKYLTGLSIILFNNENVIYVIYAALSLYVVYKIGITVFQSRLKAYISAFLLAASSFFTIQFVPVNDEQLSVALLDLPVMLFFLLGIYFFLIANKNKKYLVISSLFLSITFSMKFFPALFLLLPVLYFYIRNNKSLLKTWIFSLILIPIIYIVSHAMYFYFNPSLVEFLRYQKWIIDWRLGNPFVVGNIWRTIFTGSYKNWWDGGIVIDKEWSRFFAFIVELGLAGGIIAMLKKQKELILLFLLSSVYLVYLSINTVGVARYVLLVYPFLVILTVNFLDVGFGIIVEWKRRNLRQ